MAGVALGDIHPSLCVAGVALGHITPSLGMAGVALDDIDCYFAWQAWHLWHWAGSGGARGHQVVRWHFMTSTFTLRGRRGTWSHPPSLCVAGVALGHIHPSLCVAGVALGHIHLSLCVPGVALGNIHPSLCVAGVALGDIHPSLCVAGVALDDIDCYFAWQALHLWHWAGSGGARGHQVARWRRGSLVAGVALGHIHLHFAWQAWHLVTSTLHVACQAWHLWHWAGSGGARGHQVARWRRGSLRGGRGTS